MDKKLKETISTIQHQLEDDKETQEATDDKIHIKEVHKAIKRVQCRKAAMLQKQHLKSSLFLLIVAHALMNFVLFSSVQFSHLYPLFVANKLSWYPIN